MKENQFTIFGKVAVLLLVFYMAITSILNITKGQASNPYAFAIIIVGLICFIVAKISVISKGHKISFGTKPMSNAMGNLYRVGYWLMAIGIMLTFV